MAKDSSVVEADEVQLNKVIVKYVADSIGKPPSRSNSRSNHDTKRLRRDFSGTNLSCLSLSDLGLSASVSAHLDAYPSSPKGDSSDHRNSFDSAAMVEKFAHIPLHVRGRAEKWEIPRSEINITMKIGEGQGGIVYKCRWRALDCAAKLLLQESKTSIAYHDMVNEISVISHLRHPNLVLFLGACTVGNEPLVIINEFMAGGSLEDRIQAMTTNSRGHHVDCKPPAKLAIRWIMELSRAVCFLHSCTTPIIHRDLKPANLLLTEEDHLKVSDFGLCKTLQKVREDGTPYQMTGNCGTRRYMAPEVVKCDPQYDEKVDIYSMAMIFWYIFMGQRPFEGVQPDLVAELTSTRGMRPPTAQLAWPALEALISRMWADAAADRPAAKDIVTELAGMTPPAALLARAAAAAAAEVDDEDGRTPRCAAPRCAVM